MTTTEATPAVTSTTATTPTVDSAAAPAVVSPPRTLSIVGFVLGLVSLVTGQAVVLPAAAIILGILGYRQEPAGRTFSIFAIVLGSLALFGWMIIGALGLAFALPFFALGEFAWGWDF